MNKKILKQKIINILAESMLHYDARLRFSKFIKSEDLILDVGALSSRLTNTLKNKVIAVDLPKKGRFGFSKNSLAKLCQRENLEMSYADVVNLPFRENSFNIIICTEVLEHIHKDHFAVDEILRVLKPNGYLLITVPHQERVPFPKCGIKEHYRHYYKKDLISFFSDHQIILLQDRFKFSEDWIINKLNKKFLNSRKNIDLFFTFLAFIFKIFYILILRSLSESIFKLRPGSNLILIVKKKS